MNFKVKKCKHCGNEFQPTGGRQHYCSIECKVKDNITIDDNDCWNFTGCKNKKGYGKVRYNNKTFKTHRVMYESVHGPAPVDKPHALHSCDNPSCVNPSHLRWGSHQENMDDRSERNRSANGEQNGMSKLSEEKVIEIIYKLKNYKRGDYLKLGREYKIGAGIISDIHRNKIWRHIKR